MSLDKILRFCFPTVYAIGGQEAALDEARTVVAFLIFVVVAMGLYVMA